MPQSLVKQLTRQGILEEVVRYAELHGYIATSIKYDHDPQVILKMLLTVTGDANFGKVPILKDGDRPQDIINLLVDTFMDRLNKREERIRLLEKQLKEALTRVDYFRTEFDTRISGKVKDFIKA